MSTEKKSTVTKFHAKVAELQGVEIRVAHKSALKSLIYSISQQSVKLLGAFCLSLMTNIVFFETK